MTTGADWLDQARRLLETLRTASTGAAASAAPPTDPPTDPPAGAGGSDCRWCPLCQAAAVVRGERPEVSAALADILATAAVALREFAGETAGSEPGAGEPGAAAEQPREESAAPARPVQRIELT
jgi:hypothetical protein